MLCSCKKKTFIFICFIYFVFIFFSLLGVDISRAKNADAGLILADAIRQFMYSLDVDDGISSFGYTNSDIPALVEATLPQQRVTRLAPAGEPSADEYSMIYENSMKIY